MSILRTALGQSSWLFGSRIIGAAIQALILALLARQVTPGSLGTLVALMGILAFCSGIAELGLSPYALRTQARMGYVPNSVAVINRVTTLILYVVGMLILVVSATLLDSDAVASHALAVLAIWAGTEKNSRLWTNVLVGQGRSQRTASVHVANRVAALGIFLFLLYAIDDAITAYALAITVSAALANRVLYYSARDAVREEPEDRTFGEVLRASFPFMVNTIGVQIRNLDVTLVSLVGGAAAAGLYGLPARLTTPLRMVPSAIAPVVLRYAAKREAAYMAAIRWLIATTLLLSALGLGIFALLARYVILGVFGAQYVEAVRPLQILCIGIIFAFAVTLLTSTLQGIGRERVVGSVAVLVNVGALLFVMAGTITWGADGAAAGLAISYCLHSLILLKIWRNASNE